MTTTHHVVLNFAPSKSSTPEASLNTTPNEICIKKLDDLQNECQTTGKKRSRVNPCGALVTSVKQFKEAVQRASEEEKPIKSRKAKKSDEETTRTREKWKAKSASEEEEDIVEIPAESDHESEEQFF